jgi:hypothetical protein
MAEDAAEMQSRRSRAVRNRHKTQVKVSQQGSRSSRGVRESPLMPDRGVGVWCPGLHFARMASASEAPVVLTGALPFGPLRQEAGWAWRYGAPVLSPAR